MIQIDLKKYQLTDEIPMLLDDAFRKYNEQDNHPCSICRQHMKDQEGRRMHFHGSDFGSCSRKVAWKMHRGNVPANKLVPYEAPAWYLKDGHLHEASILTAFAHDKRFDIFINQNEAEIKFHIPFFDPTNSEDGDSKMMTKKFVLTPYDKRVSWHTNDPQRRRYTLVAHVDAIVKYTSEDGEKETFGIECKAVKEETWKEVKSGLISQEWWGQMQCYMFVTGIDKWYLVVKNRTSSAIAPPIRVDYDPAFVISRIQKFNKVYAMLNYQKSHLIPIPKDKNPKDKECLFCPFGRECHNVEKVVERNGDLQII